MSTPETLEVAVPVATVWTGPDAPRDVDAPAVADLPDPAAWTAALGPEERVGLMGRTLTQALLGEPVQVLAEQGDWAEVRLPWQRSSLDPGGYPGWVRRAHLAEPVLHADRSAGPTAHVTSATAHLRMDEGRAQEVSLGTALWVDTTAPSEVAVLLPGGRRGWLPLADVRVADKAVAPTWTPTEVLATARGFTGLRYLWGGLSSWGVDCSGLVHLAHRVHGTLLPRDAHDQAAALEEVPLDRVEPGDLWFFAPEDGQRITHVGLVSDRSGDDGSGPLLLHAPERDGGGLVEEAPMDEQRRATLRCAARPLPAV